MAKDYNTNRPVLLVGVPDLEEADRIVELLERYDIPCSKKADTSDDFTEILSASSGTGYEIYVPDSQLPFALSLLREEDGEIDESEIETEWIEDSLDEDETEIDAESFYTSDAAILDGFEGDAASASFDDIEDEEEALPPPPPDEGNSISLKGFLLFGLLLIVILALAVLIAKKIL